MQLSWSQREVCTSERRDHAVNGNTDYEPEGNTEQEWKATTNDLFIVWTEPPSDEMTGQVEQHFEND